MAEEPTVSVSDTVWEKWLGAYMVAMGKNMREALFEEWPLLMRKVMDFTPPFATKASRGEGKAFSNSASDLSVGRKAVAFDIYKVMRPFNPAARTKNLERILDRQDVAAFNILASRSKNPLMAGHTAVHFNRQLHLQARNARGRVWGHDRKQVVIGSDVGLLKEYVAGVQKRVGYAKSGWLKALLLVGGEAPAYVTNKGTTGGDVVDNHADEENPSITAINRTPWAVRQDEGSRILSDAKASRIEAIIAKVKARCRLADEQAKGA